MSAPTIEPAVRHERPLQGQTVVVIGGSLGIGLETARLAHEEGAKVILTRPNDHGVGPCITKRAAIGNDAKADAAVSVHADGAATGEHGFHVILPKPIPGHTAKMAPDARRLGFALRDSYKKSTGMPYSTYRGENAIDERDDLGGLNLSTRPKVFIARKIRCTDGE